MKGDGTNGDTDLGPGRNAGTRATTREASLVADEHDGAAGPWGSRLWMAGASRRASHRVIDQDRGRGSLHSAQPGRLADGAALQREEGAAPVYQQGKEKLAHAGRGRRHG